MTEEEILKRRAVGDILTYSGLTLNIFDPKPESFTIEDIAQGLSNTSRFGGQIQNFYSVAQHSYYVSMDLKGEKQLWGLLHDASEAYIQDIITPLKNRLEVYRDIEDKMMIAIAKAFNLPNEFLLELDDKTSDIKRIDHKQFLWEWEHLKVGNVKGWLPEEAKTKFLKRYDLLTKKREAVSLV